jgi:hypothetical protein
MSVSAAPEDTKTVNHRIDVVDLSAAAENMNTKGLVSEAIEQGFKPAERYLRKLECRSEK